MFLYPQQPGESKQFVYVPAFFFEIIFQHFFLHVFADFVSVSNGIAHRFFFIIDLHYGVADPGLSDANTPVFFTPVINLDRRIIRKGNFMGFFNGNVVFRWDKIRELIKIPG